MQVLLEDNKKEKDTTRQAIRPHRLLEIRIFFIILSRKQTSRKKTRHASIKNICCILDTSYRIVHYLNRILH